MWMTRILLAFVLVGMSAATAQAAPEFYVSVAGALQGPFKGEVLDAKGLVQGKFAGLSFEYEVVSARDAATGQLTQKRSHRPIRIQKTWGPASLQLYSALLKNESLSVAIDFVTTDPATGQSILSHSVKLTGAAVASFRSHSEPGQSPKTDTVELVFQKIELVDHKGKAAVMDNLVAP
jgi:type VI secretion system Hcp family effector